MPITGLTVEALGGTAKDKGKNIFVLGLIAKIFHLDVEKLKTLIQEKFRGKDESIANTALMAFPRRLRLSGRQCSDDALSSSSTVAASRGGRDRRSRWMATRRSPTA